MPHFRVSITRAANGYSVQLPDPKIVERNQSDKTPGYEDPEVKFVFDTKDKVLEFLKKTLDTALPESTFSSAFDQAVEEVESDG